MTHGSTNAESLARLRSQLNGGRIMMPLFRAMVAWPGLKAEQNVYMEAFDEMSSLCRAVRERVEQRLEGGQAGSPVRHLIARPVAELVGAAWESAHHSANGSDQMDADRLAETYLALIQVSETNDPPDTGAVSPSTQQLLSEAQALGVAIAGLTPVWALPPATQGLYIGGASPAVLVQSIRDSITLAAQDAGARVAEGLDQTQAQVVYRVSLNAFGELYRSILDAEFDALTRQIKSLDPEGREQYLADLTHFPKGPLMQRVDDLFDALAPQVFSPADISPSASGAQ